jgi:hypothetical protein
MRLASMLRGASEREEPPEAPAPATSPRHKQRWRSALAFAKTQTRDESGPAVFSHQGPDGAWEPYDAARCLEISAAMEAQGPDGAIQLDGIPFEVRWGSRATSSRVATCVEINQCAGCTAVHTIEQASRRWRGGRRDGSARTRRTILISTQVATPPAEGMIQVNLKNDNTRIVRRERTVEVFSHQGPDGSWENYDAARCEEISKAMKDQGPDGAVQLEGIPFEVRWGARATSSRVATCVEIKFTARSSTG